jgi:hypothetical protein
MSEYTPVVYVKAGRERTARSASAAVALEFDGYKPKVVAAPAAPVKVEAPEAPVVEAPVEVAEPKAIPAPRPPKTPLKDEK